MVQNGGVTLQENVDIRIHMHIADVLTGDVMWTLEYTCTLQMSLLVMVCIWNLGNLRAKTGNGSIILTTVSIF